jgi:uncharacterized protein
MQFRNSIPKLHRFGNNLKAIEIKAGKTIASDFLKNLQLFQKTVGDMPLKSYVIYGGNTTQMRSDAHILGWEKMLDVLQ